MLRTSCHAIVLALLAVTPLQALAEDRYYAVVFAAQSEPRRAKLSHTFMTLVKVKSTCTEECDLKIDTISWLPPCGTFKVWDLCAEEGKNFDLHASVNLVLGKCEHLYAWCPMEITCDAYERFLAQKCRLDSGRRKYKAIDVPIPWVKADNCWHAITRAIPGDTKCHSPWWEFGEPSGRHIVKAMHRHRMVVSDGHDWIFEQLGLSVSAKDGDGRTRVFGIADGHNDLLPE